MSARISHEMIKPFCGDTDVVAWLKEVKVLAELHDISDLASFMPLYLDGPAFALYLAMEETDRLSAEKIEIRLMEAYAEGMFEAYARLSRTRWTGEQVDVFADELRRLAKLAGYEGESLDRTVRLAFVTGFPDNMSVELELLPNIHSMPMADIVFRAGELVSCSRTTSVAATATTKSGRARSSGEGSKKERVRPFKGQCFRCQGPHMVRDCESPKPEVICYRCREPGHIASECLRRNGLRETTAPVVVPSDQ
ncbi:uncharacterized protein LOC118764022 [Octopus sinensis]|uniref:Uncharacterized protein LOC118764022 n=1 Tax=Octopus sinensis TaxID=2607531 RepID=A0A7E6EYR6_9MOLL|nr:uncharacterized protein LOC118764022 [Octopus sinensis]